MTFDSTINLGDIIVAIATACLAVTAFWAMRESRQLRKENASQQTKEHKRRLLEQTARWAEDIVMAVSEVSGLRSTAQLSSRFQETKRMAYLLHFTPIRDRLTGLGSKGVWAELSLEAVDTDVQYRVGLLSNRIDSCLKKLSTTEEALHAHPDEAWLDSKEFEEAFKQLRQSIREVIDAAEEVSGQAAWDANVM